MGDDTETITVAELSDGPPIGHSSESLVNLPVVEILTGRGFITGKSGSGKSNTASVIAEKLLDSGFGLLIVDIDGEYYGLKEEYEILHVGADEECDIQVTVDHAEKIASLALEQNVPIILDISSFLDEDEAEQLLTAVSKQLFAKEKKLKQPFLMLVEEVHEWIPEKGSVGECGQMLIKIGKRGRKHGLGMVGISQRPADVKKDFITQCDWLVWHRLTWNNDTKVVSRILDTEYAAAVENLNDGEAFMMNDWSESVKRVQFHRKTTFDAGATPGLEDVDRPDLKSVSSDLVSELEEISEEKQRTEDKIQELKAELDRKNSRISELEAELQDARDMSRMADQFVTALVEHVNGVNPGRTEKERMRDKRARTQKHNTSPGPNPSTSTSTSSEASPTQDTTADLSAQNTTEDHSVQETDDKLDQAEVGDQTGADNETVDGWLSAADAAAAAEQLAAEVGNGEHSSSHSSSDRDVATAIATSDDVMSNGDETAVSSGHTEGVDAIHTDEMSASELSADGENSRGESMEMSQSSESESQHTSGDELSVVSAPWPAEQSEPDADYTPQDHAIVDELISTIESMESKTRGMLRYYRNEGPAKPLDAHFAGGGDGDRTDAYAHNRTLRTHGFIEHVGRGHYGYNLRDHIANECDGQPSEDELNTMVEAVERAFLT